MKRHISVLVAGASAFTALPAMAHVLLIDGQGVSPNRVAVYVEDATLDKTPVSLETINTPTRIRQIDLSMIYEAVNQPHWAEYHFQFKCPNRFYQKKLGRPVKAGKAWVLPDQDVVEFRMAGGAKSMKQSPNIEDLKPTEWQTTSSYTMKRAWRVACDGDAIMAAKTASAGADRAIDRNLLRPKLAAMGLNDAELVPDGLTMSSLADFTWTNLWKDVRKPAINHGRKLTPAEQRALAAQVAQMKRDVESAQTTLTNRATEMKVVLDFAATAAAYRGKRRLSRTESILLQVWLGKTEQDVVAANGAPSVAQAGNARFLSYGQSFDNRVMWQSMASSATFTTGGYASCNVRYALIPDSAGELRVADVAVFGSSQGDTQGMGNTCTDILNVPNR